MEPSELQLIVDAVTQLGEQGKAAFIWWLVLDKLVPVVAWTGGLTAFIVALYKICMHFAHASQVEAEMCRLRDRLGIGHPGHLNPEELNRTSRRLRELIRKEENSNG